MLWKAASAASARWLPAPQQGSLDDAGAAETCGGAEHEPRLRTVIPWPSSWLRPGRGWVGGTRAGDRSHHPLRRYVCLAVTICHRLAF